MTDQARKQTEDFYDESSEDPLSPQPPKGGPVKKKHPVKKQHEVREYTPGEEIANAVTHGIGVVLSIPALVLLITTAIDHGGGIRLAAAIIFGVTLLLEYTASTLYHAFPWPKVKKVFKVLDHSSIYLLIAGTYTPFTLIALVHEGGMWMTALIWGLAIIGIAVETLWLFRPRWVSALIYLAMGWLIIFKIGALIAVVPSGGVILLVVGGLAYTVGTVFYVLKKIPYMHSIWHLWVLVGSICHFLAVLLYVI